MRKAIFMSILTWLCLGRAEAQLQIVTTLPDFATIAEAVGGEQVRAKAIVKGYQDPHYLEAKPSFMRLLNRADLLVYNGLELEVGWLPLVLQGARNPKVALGSPGHLNASAGIARLQVPAGQVDRSMGDVHPEGNPHFTLDPRNSILIAKQIADRLAALDPAHADTFNRNRQAFESQMQKRIDEWEQRAAAIRGKRLIAYHDLFPYLQSWLGFDVAGCIENKPGIPPSPRHTSDVIALMRQESIDIILCAPWSDVRAAERIASETGARIVTIPVLVGGDAGVDTYPDLIETIVTRLLAACHD